MSGLAETVVALRDQVAQLQGQLEEVTADRDQLRVKLHSRTNELERALAVVTRTKEDHGPFEIDRPGTDPGWCCNSCGVYGDEERIGHSPGCLYLEACAALGEGP